MPIPYSQLETWSHQGATATSASAYASLTRALQHDSSPLAARKPKIFLQGSYANDTNIYGDSDIDVVVLYEGTFHKDMSSLTPEQVRQHESDYSTATYQWRHLRDDVIATLQAYYGSDAVKQGKKSIKVMTGHGGRPADVIPALQFRKYTTYANRSDFRAHWGIQFFDSAGNAIVNYPKYHRERGEEKNQDARTWGLYKPTIRLFKNLRNCMTDQEMIKEGLAPSYFLECALHNVPDELFRGDFDATAPTIIDWLHRVSVGTLRCQNGMGALCGTASTQWSDGCLGEFARQAGVLWNTWYS